MEDLFDLVFMVAAWHRRQRVILDGLLNVEVLAAFGAFVFIGWHYLLLASTI